MYAKILKNNGIQLVLLNFMKYFIKKLNFIQFLVVLSCKTDIFCCFD